MRKTRLVLIVLGIAVLLQACSLSLGSGRIGSLDHASIEFRTQFDPWWPLPSLSTTSVLLGEEGVAHHVLLDKSEKTYFGYDITIEPTEEAGAVQITLRDLTATPEQLRREHPGEWTQLPSPSYPGPRVVYFGDTIMAHLMIHKGTGQRIIDYLTVHPK